MFIPTPKRRRQIREEAKAFSEAYDHARAYAKAGDHKTAQFLLNAAGCCDL
jgi:hypothetical protein